MKRFLTYGLTYKHTRVLEILKVIEKKYYSFLLMLEESRISEPMSSGSIVLDRHLMSSSKNAIYY
ncbi:hypothetical protein AM501_23600 [Aneurinibacillus migulanus]|uniref:Uncharacterized protein n=1 Tax=Aneurinibacillus migulanus TaxID=47500 RepID=A0A0D1XFH7_ANEMI|nr:hypothetical protein [Aneurinibacillus migulanus]KIV53096.1 hypothetical protein TS65_20580 [Aneurinibacillus migulanus]KIV59415.1 hypothetical protein TS64_03255 [Aneurinibacillus migulanus]KON84045.1 hypothetical protein AF333_29165 [Aneurinibacillus migulanus]KPD05868.1 hypothetical protein AM501_23600 [Aneurinibacillus migulanus]MED0895191.1 hypothetical protein [Aneurinibacillus migulanus]